jgi:hypothetical protein
MQAELAASPFTDLEPDELAIFQPWWTRRA